MRGKRYLRLLLLMAGCLGLLLSLSWLPLFSQAQAALAHAFVIGSDPIDGSTINTAPTMVRIFFNADISSASSARVIVFAPNGPANGLEVDGGHSSIPAGNARELDTPLLSPASLPQGSYEVKWTALALDDGHATSGLIGFNLGYSVTGLSGTPALGPSTSNHLPQLNMQGVLSVMWEWLTALALTFWVGMAMMEGLLFARARAAGDDLEGGVLASLRRHGRALQWLCLTAVLVGEIINLVLRGALLTQANEQSGIDPTTIRKLVFDTSYGHLWIARFILVCLALAFLWWTTRQQNQQRRQQAARLSGTMRPGKPAANRFSQLRMQVVAAQKAEESADVDGEATTRQEPGTQAKLTASPVAPIAALPTTPILPSPMPVRPATVTGTQRWHIIAWLALAGLILFTLALSSDTAHLAQAQYSAAILTWLRLLAQAAWFGGAAYLGFVLLPQAPTLEPDHNGKFLLNLLNAYTPLLLLAFGVLLLGNLFLAETTISNAQQWLSDPYGRALLIQLLVFALMLIFTIYGFFFVKPALRRQVALLSVVQADLPARRARRSALEQTERRLKLSMHILAVLGAGVLLCAALMSFFAPPIVFPKISYVLTITNADGSPVATPAANTFTQQAGNLTVTLQVAPGRVNVANTVSITLKDSSGNLITNAHIQAITNMQVMDMGTINKDLSTAGNNGTYRAVFQPNEAFSMIGAWDISLTIQQPNHTPVQTQFVITLTS